MIGVVPFPAFSASAAASGPATPAICSSRAIASPSVANLRIFSNMACFLNIPNLWIIGPESAGTIRRIIPAFLHRTMAGVSEPVGSGIAARRSDDARGRNPLRPAARDFCHGLLSPGSAVYCGWFLWERAFPRRPPHFQYLQPAPRSAAPVSPSPAIRYSESRPSALRLRLEEGRAGEAAVENRRAVLPIFQQRSSSVP